MLWQGNDFTTWGWTATALVALIAILFLWPRSRLAEFHMAVARPRQAALLAFFALLAISIAFFVLVALFYSWPPYHPVIWRFSTFLLIPCFLILYSENLPPKMIWVLCALVPMSVWNTHWQQHATGRVITGWLNDVMPAVSEVQTPNTGLTFPYRKTSRVFNPKLAIPGFNVCKVQDGQEGCAWASWPGGPNIRTLLRESRGLFPMTSANPKLDAEATALRLYWYAPPAPK
jgi:hypothetical protein